MLARISNIHSISVIQQFLESNIYGLKELEFDSNSIGSGGVGSIYKVLNVDGQTKSGLLIKIIEDESSDNLNKSTKAYETISLLHSKIKKWQEISQSPLYYEYPELIGLPFMAFKGNLSNGSKECSFFLTFDLTQKGFVDFGADDWDRLSYNNLDFAKKIFLAHQYVTAVNFLHEMKFIHADLKDESIFLNLNKPFLSLIDFDGGYNYDIQPFALTIGAINKWASPKWLKNIFLGKSSQEFSTQDRLDEENWVVACAVFELLFSVTPFFFLNDQNEETVSGYLKKHKWPLAKPGIEYVNDNNLTYLNSLIEVFEEFKKMGYGKLLDTFSLIFNQGYKNPKKRLKPFDWIGVLEGICKENIPDPEIVKYEVDKNEIKSKDDEINVRWEIEFAKKIFLNGKIQDLFSNSSLFIPKDECDIIIEAENDFSKSTQTIHINAKKIDPKIKSFSSNISQRVDLSPVYINWKVENCKSVLINGMAFSPSGEMLINPLVKSKYILRAYGHFDQIIETELEVDVIAPKILDFHYEINIEKGIDNVDLFWETTDAIEVQIYPMIGTVENTGIASIRIPDKKEFTITAKGYFSEVFKVIEAQPFPIPLIKGIFVPTPTINMSVMLPENNLKIPDFLNMDLAIKFNNSIEFNNILPDFVKIENEINQIEKSKSVWLKPFDLFDNLFKRLRN